MNGTLRLYKPPWKGVWQMLKYEKNKIKTLCSPAVPLEIESRVSKRSMYSHVHSSIMRRTYTVTATEAVRQHMKG